MKRTYKNGKTNTDFTISLSDIFEDFYTEEVLRVLADTDSNFVDNVKAFMESEYEDVEVIVK